MSLALETHRLSKTFDASQGWCPLARPRAIPAVQDVTFQVATGEIFGLLGPNGAGKTTLVKLLCTLIRPSDGEAMVAGYPLSRPAAIRAAVGLAVSDERSFFWRLTGRQNLDFFATLYGLSGRPAQQRVAELLEAVGLSDQADERFSHYSSGMKQRLSIARGLLHRPRLLFLDEPTRSLDPTTTQRLHRLIRQLQADQGLTVFLITHDLSEAEKLCQRVAIMHAGRLWGVGAAAELRQHVPLQRRYTLVVDQLPPAALEALQHLTPDLTHLAHEIQLRAAPGSPTLTEALDILRAHGVRLLDVAGDLPTLEDVFAALTTHEAG